MSKSATLSVNIDVGMAKFPFFYKVKFLKLGDLHPYLFGKNWIFTVSLVLVTIIAAISETVTIGILIPLLSALLGDVGLSISALESFITLLPLKYFGGSEILQILAVYLFVVILASIIRVVHLYMLNYVAFRIGAQLASDLFEKVLLSNYEESRNLSSADTVIDLMPRVNTIVFGVILPIFTGVTNFIITIIVFFLLVYVLSEILLVLFFCLASTFFISWFVSRRLLTKNGQIISESLRGAAETTIETIKNKKYIDLNKKYKFYLNQFRSFDGVGKHAAAKNQFIIGLPRYVLEVIISVVFVAYISINFIQGIDLKIVVAELAIAIVVFQRIFPLSQSIFRSVTLINSNAPVMKDAFKLFDMDSVPIESAYNSTFEFNESIELKDLNFSYSGSKSNLYLKTIKILKGQKVLLSGESGIGKTTVVDILMCLLNPGMSGLKAII